MTRPGILAALAAASLLAAGCGSQNDPASFPDPATPAASPPLTREPTSDPAPTEDTDAALIARLREDGRGPRTTARLDDGGTATLDPRARTLTITGPDGTERAQAPAGIGPTHVVLGDEGRLYVTDTAGRSVLLFRSEPELKLWRRAGLDGSPYGTALDREKGKLWVTLTDRNEAVQLTADGAPRVQRRFPTVRQPDAIAIDPASGRVAVLGKDAVQTFDGYPAPGGD